MSRHRTVAVALRQLTIALRLDPQHSTLLLGRPSRTVEWQVILPILPFQPLNEQHP